MSRKSLPRKYVNVLKGVTRSELKMKVENRELGQGLRLEYENYRDETLEISMEDVEEARLYWQYSVIGYELGENVPYTVMENFVKI